MEHATVPGAWIVLRWALRALAVVPVILVGAVANAWVLLIEILR